MEPVPGAKKVGDRVLGCWPQDTSVAKEAQRPPGGTDMWGPTSSPAVPGPGVTRTLI